MERNRFFRQSCLWFTLVACLLSFVITSPVFALGTENYEQGFRFGQAYKNEIMTNIRELQDKAVENKRDPGKLISYARRTENLYESVLPEKIEWMKGVADGSGIPYEDVLVFNTADRMITGFVGECTTFIAHGKAVTGGGSIIAKNRDLGFQTLIEIGLHQGATHPKGAVYKAAYIDIPQSEATYKFIGSRTAGRWGYGMGINEHQVAVSDNDAPSRDKLEFKEGLHDNDLVRIVLERAKTAREGVDVIAAVVSKYGQAWNGIMFEIGDPEELWVVEITGRRWAAKKYTDTVTARSNQYQIGDDYDLAAPDLVSFAASQGWVKEGTEKINFRKVYSAEELYPEDNDLSKRKNVEKLYNTEMRYQRAMELLNANQGKVTPELVMSMCRDHFDTYTLPSGKTIKMNQVPFYSSEYADWLGFEWYTTQPEKDEVPCHMYVRGPCSHDLGWGTTSSSGILVSRPGVSDELGLMLHAFSPPCNSAYVPFYVGISDVDKRYTTPEAAVAFQSVMTRAFTKYTLHHDAIRKAFDPYEAGILKEMPEIEGKFEELKKAGKQDEAVGMLTSFVKDKCADALNQVKAAHDNMTGKIYDKNKWSR
ncbi:C45 family autoproteolytic acyltransferase/hydrolase [Desulfococcaceae bacterium HSG8]|nr:C45 family autoproteolytic acyltransferase/hydrolase [Desulfococcaceae bacterium HSG8]